MSKSPGKPYGLFGNLRHDQGAKDKYGDQVLLGEYATLEEADNAWRNKFHGVPYESGYILTPDGHTIRRTLKRWRKCGGEGGTPGPCPDPHSDQGASSTSSKPLTPKTPEEVNALHKELGSKMPELSEDQEEAMGEYISGAYVGINKSLREGKGLEPGQRGYKELQEIKSTIDSAPTLEQPISVYRGLRLTKEQGAEFLAQAEAAAKSGGTIEDKAFVSSTIDPNTATAWATGGKGAEVPVVMQISARKGLYLGQSVGGTKEKEYVMNAGSKFRVLGVEDAGTHKVVRVEQEVAA